MYDNIIYIYMNKYEYTYIIVHILIYSYKIKYINDIIMITCDDQNPETANPTTKHNHLI